MAWWNTDNKFPKEESRRNELGILYDGLWENFCPLKTFHFFCKRIEKISGKDNRSLEITANDLKNAKKITVQWKYQFPGKGVLAKWELLKRTGFIMTWYVVDEGGQRHGIQKEDKEVWTSRHEVEAIFIDENYQFSCFCKPCSTSIRNQHMS